MVNNNKNFQAKFEETLSFIVMPCYYVDNLLSIKIARALNHVAWILIILHSSKKQKGPVHVLEAEKVDHI